MKKFLLILVAFLALSFTYEAEAQVRDFIDVEITTDTLTDSGTVYADFSRLTKPWDYVLFAKADKLTGTVTGTIILQVSPDGTNWITHPTADTLTYTNVSDGLLTSVLTGTDLIYPYLRAAVTGSGTSTSIWTMDLILKK